MLKGITLAVTTGFTPFALAATIHISGIPIEITSVDANGSGCKPDSISVTTTPDNTQAAILFSDYRAQTTSDMTVANSDCNIAVGLSVEPGFSVGIIGIDWRGTTVTSPGAFINFHREFFFSGTKGPAKDDFWSDAGFDNFFLEDDPVFVTYSDCDGTPLIARADTSATVVGTNSFFSLRSADIEAALLLNLQIRRCQ